MELRCVVQQYAWGKIGYSSEVALLNSAGDPDFVVNTELPYAELWMGVHPSGPTVIKETSQTLSDWIAAHPATLGDEVIKRFGNQLPFLFKVLSVNKALSIQAHPNKAHAEELHALLPDMYKDPNHKPELAIALTPFEALCGFCPMNEIKHYLKVVPELRTVIGEEAVSKLENSDETNLQQALKKCFWNLMSAPKFIVEEQLGILMKRIGTLPDASSRTSVKADLVQRLYCEYPGDVGCFGVYFFNWLELKPGESIYLGANEPHAYLSGDCIEIMACSDNVVRAGLTPKHKDVDTLCNMLTYICEDANSKKFQGQPEDNFTIVFKPPVPDFAVAKIMVPHGTKQYQLIPRKSASITIVIDGEAECNKLKVQRGSVFFLAADQPCTVELTKQLLMFQAFSNVDKDVCVCKKL